MTMMYLQYIGWLNQFWSSLFCIVSILLDVFEGTPVLAFIR